MSSLFNRTYKMQLWLWILAAKAAAEEPAFKHIEGDQVFVTKTMIWIHLGFYEVNEEKIKNAVNELKDYLKVNGKKIKFFGLRACPGITAGDLIEILKYLPRVEQLDLGCNIHITEDEWANLVVPLASHLHLKKIDLGFTKVTDVSVTTLLKSDSLEEINLGTEQYPEIDLSNDKLTRVSAICGSEWPWPGKDKAIFYLNKI